MLSLGESCFILMLRNESAHWSARKQRSPKPRHNTELAAVHRAGIRHWTTLGSTRLGRAQSVGVLCETATALLANTRLYTYSLRRKQCKYYRDYSQKRNSPSRKNRTSHLAKTYLELFPIIYAYCRLENELYRLASDEDIALRIEYKRCSKLVVSKSVVTYNIFLYCFRCNAVCGSPQRIDARVYIHMRGACVPSYIIMYMTYTVPAPHGSHMVVRINCGRGPSSSLCARLGSLFDDYYIMGPLGQRQQRPLELQLREDLFYFSCSKIDFEVGSVLHSKALKNTYRLLAAKAASGALARAKVREREKEI
uniref:Uncharacterized protein n=1 Tax=Trichogramma kaykai TaxID=54128 RepID=A0ABD2WQQ3_9HYME